MPPRHVGGGAIWAVALRSLSGMRGRWTALFMSLPSIHSRTRLGRASCLVSLRSQGVHFRRLPPERRSDSDAENTGRPFGIFCNCPAGRISPCPLREVASTDFAIRQLAARAGLSHHTTENLIGSKSAVLYALLNRLLDRIDIVRMLKGEDADYIGHIYLAG